MRFDFDEVGVDIVQAKHVVLDAKNTLGGVSDHFCIQLGTSR